MHLFVSHYFFLPLLCTPTPLQKCRKNELFCVNVEIQGNERKSSVVDKGTVLQAALEKWLRLKFAYDEVFLAYAYDDNAS